MASRKESEAYSTSSFIELLGSSTIPALLADGDCLKLLDLNEAAASFFGKPAEELRGVDVSKLLMPSHWQELQTALSGGASTSVEDSYRRPDGSTALMQMTHQPCSFEGDSACLIFLYDVTSSVERAQRAVGRSTEEIEAERIAREHAALTWDKLAANRSLMLTFLDHAPLSIYVKDSRGRYLFHNRFARELCPQTENSVGKTDYDLFPVDVAEDFRRNDYAVIAANRPIETIEVLSNPDAPPRHFISAKFPLHAEGETYICGMSLEVTDQIKNESERRMLSQMLDFSTQPIITVDLSDRITFWNTGAAGLYGYNEEEALGKNIHEFLRTRFPEPLEEIERKMALAGTWRGELHHLTKDDRELIVQSRWDAARDMQGQPIGRIELNTDVTEERRISRSLAESEARFRTLAENNPFFIWASKTLGVPYFISSHFYDYTGLEPGGDWEKVVHPEDLELLWQAGDRSLRGEPYSVQFRMRHAADNTYRWHMARAYPLRNADGSTREWVGMTWDIHERKTAELMTRSLDRAEGASHAAQSLARQIDPPLAALEALFAADGSGDKWRSGSELVSRMRDVVTRFGIFHSDSPVAPGKRQTFEAGVKVQNSGLYSIYHPTWGTSERVILVAGGEFPECVCCGKRCTYTLINAAPYVFDDEDFRQS